MHRLMISISTSRYFDTQREMAEFLDIKGTSKKAINSHCRQCGWGVEFAEGSEYDLEPK